MTGTAPWSWVEHAPSKVLGVSGVTHVRIDGIKQTGIDQKLAWNQYLAKIAELPGILVLKQGCGRNAFYISGMRDSMAPDPVEILVESGMDTNAVVSHWEPFQALHPSLIIARARRMLEPPAGVEMELEGRGLKLKGSASHSWISEARLIARGIAGISEFDTSELNDLDLDEFKALIPVFNEYVFYYLVNHRDLWPGQETKYKEFIASVKKFRRVSARIGGGYHIEIRGHVLSSGSKDVDKAASDAIAELFYARLKNQGVDMNIFSTFGAGGIAAEAAARSEERKRESHVSFSIVSDD
jgi:OOP family OmpA-OmpF porin